MALLVCSIPLSAFGASLAKTDVDDISFQAKGYSTYGHELHEANGEIVFCVQYGVTSPSGSYSSSTLKKLVNSDISSYYSEYMTIARYIYFGYTSKYGTDFPDSDAFPDEDDLEEALTAACSCQQWIWEYVYENITTEYGYPTRSGFVEFIPK